MCSHSTIGVAVSCMETGVLPISTFANDLGSISYHNYEHATQSDDVCDRLVSDLLPGSQVMLLRNHGNGVCILFLILFAPVPNPEIVRRPHIRAHMG